MLKLCSCPPSLACVINNYNYEQYLARAIESALSQTVPFRQIIVVDDGSTDSSRHVIARFEGRVTIIETKNHGQTSACLTALDAVQTDYVLFLDADDYLTDYVVDEISHVLTSGNRPVKIQYQLITVDDGGCEWGCFPTYAPRYTTEDMRLENQALGFYRSPPTSGNVFKVDTLRAFDRRQLAPRGAIDGTLNLLMPYVGEIVSLGKPLAFKREHPRSISAWSAPTTALLEKEIRTFKETWREASKLMGWPARDFDGEPPLYLIERALMLDSLSNRNASRAAYAYCRALLKRPPGHAETLALCAWALFLCVPMRGWREWAIKARRSPINRGGNVDRIMRFALRKAQPDRAAERIRT